MATKKKPVRKRAKKAAPRKTARKKPAKKRLTPKPSARKAGAKKAARKRSVVRRPAASAPSPAPLAAQSAPPKRNGLMLGLLVIGLLLAVLWRAQREAPVAPAQAQAEAAATAPAPEAAPEGRSASLAENMPRVSASRPKPEASIRREAAGEVGEPSLTFDRSDGGTLSVRCWRPANGRAQLDVFGPRNTKVRSLQSPDGAAGWQTLEWDGKDESGKKVKGGLYYLRPSADGLQQIRDLWVKG